MAESTMAEDAGADAGALMVVGPRRGRKRSPRIEPRDFRHPAQPTGAQLRELEGLAARIGYQIRGTMENILKTPVECEPEHPGVKAWGDVVEQIPATSWALPLTGEKGERAAMIIDDGLQKHLIMRLLGGGDLPSSGLEDDESAGEDESESTPETQVTIGEISRAALLPLVRTALKDLAIVLREDSKSRDDDEDMDVELYSLNDARRRSAPRRFMRAAEAVTEFSYRITEGEGVGAITIVVQSHSLVNLLRVEDTAVVGSKDEKTKGRLETMVRDLGMRMSLRLGGATIDLAEFLRLQVDDVLVLDQRVGEPLDVMVGEQRRFVGQPGRSRGRVAVRIIGKSEQKETT